MECWPSAFCNCRWNTLVVSNRDSIHWNQFHQSRLDHQSESFVTRGSRFRRTDSNSCHRIGQYSRYFVGAIMAFIPIFPICFQCGTDQNPCHCKVVGPTMGTAAYSTPWMWILGWKLVGFVTCVVAAVWNLVADAYAEYGLMMTAWWLCRSSAGRLLSSVAAVQPRLGMSKSFIRFGRWHGSSWLFLIGMVHQSP